MTEEQEQVIAEAKRPPVNVDVPHVQQEGSVVTCTMGNWDGEPRLCVCMWRIDGAVTGADSPSLQLSKLILARQQHVWSLLPMLRAS